MPNNKLTYGVTLNKFHEPGDNKIMFIPIGGVFVFGNGITPGIAIASAVFNLFMAGLALFFGYMFGVVFLVVIGYIILAFAILRLMLTLMAAIFTPPVVHRENTNSNQRESA